MSAEARLAEKGSAGSRGPGVAAPSVPRRTLIAVGIAIVVAYVEWRLPRMHPSIIGDFGQLPAAARSLLAGGNPYEAVGPGRAYEWGWPLFYPLTAVLAAIPFAPLTHVGANMAFAGLSAGLLAFAITHDGYARLPLFLSNSYFYAVSAVQWAPILTAATLLPSLGWLLACKPTIGAALFLYRPSRRAAVLAAVFVVVSVIVRPGWPAEWYGELAHATHFGSPIGVLGGPLILLALLRWRRPEARMMVALACVPQTMTMVEAIPLFLIPQSIGQTLVLAWLTHFGGFLTEYLSPYPTLDARVTVAGPVLVAVAYLPCVILLLRRPNEGPTPAWLERAVAHVSRLPRPRELVR